MSLTKDLLFPLGTAIVGAVVGAYATHVAAQSQKRSAEVQAAKDQGLAFFRQLRFHLDASLAAFNNQALARDRLVVLLGRNHGPLPTLEYEPLFRRYYKVLNEDEKVLFQVIRGITKTALHQHNEAMSTLLRQNPTQSAELREFDALREHLDLWLSKYTAMKDREDVCLVYIGVDEKKPFPSHVGESVEAILASRDPRRTGP